MLGDTETGLTGSEIARSLRGCGIADLLPGMSAAEWNVIERVPCTVKLLKAPKTTATFHDFEAYERLVDYPGDVAPLKAF